MTGIVVVEHWRGELRFRCYGARRFAAAIAESLNVPLGSGPPPGA